MYERKFLTDNMYPHYQLKNNEKTIIYSLYCRVYVCYQENLNALNSMGVLTPMQNIKTVNTCNT